MAKFATDDNYYSILKRSAIEPLSGHTRFEELYMGRSKRSSGFAIKEPNHV